MVQTNVALCAAIHHQICYKMWYLRSFRIRSARLSDMYIWQITFRNHNVISLIGCPHIINENVHIAYLKPMRLKHSSVSDCLHDTFLIFSITCDERIYLTFCFFINNCRFTHIRRSIKFYQSHAFFIHFKFQHTTCLSYNIRLDVNIFCIVLTHLSFRALPLVQREGYSDNA